MSYESIRPKGNSWGNVRKEFFTSEENAASEHMLELRVALAKARNEKGITQKRLEEMSGVKQPIIARMERGNTRPRLDTVLKALAPLGKTLYVGDIKSIVHSE